MSERIDLDEPLHGGCQCGKIRFVTRSLYDNAHVCHCRMCQKAFGNLFAALVGVSMDRFEWTRGIPATFRSSEFVERGFCPSCGTPLTFQHGERGHRMGIAIGAFDRPEKIPLKFQIGMEGRLPQVDQLSRLADYGTTEADDPDRARAIELSIRQHPDHETDVWPQ